MYLSLTRCRCRGTCCLLVGSHPQETVLTRLKAHDGTQAPVGGVHSIVAWRRDSMVVVIHLKMAGERMQHGHKVVLFAVSSQCQHWSSRYRPSCVTPRSSQHCIPMRIYTASRETMAQCKIMMTWHNVVPLPFGNLYTLAMYHKYLQLADHWNECGTSLDVLCRRRWSNNNVARCISSYVPYDSRMRAYSMVVEWQGVDLAIRVPIRCVHRIDALHRKACAQASVIRVL